MNEFFAIAFKLLVCHLIGDYLIQTDFIAETKGQNFYHLLIHCVLYLVPFIFVGVMENLLGFIFATHVAIDYHKAMDKKIDYMTDQILHYVVLLFVAILIV